MTTFVDPIRSHVGQVVIRAIHVQASEAPVEPELGRANQRSCAPRQSTGTFITIAGLLILLAWLSTGVQAQQVFDPDDDEVRPGNVPAFEISMENFDIWVYGNQGASHNFHERLDALLNLRMEEIDRVCGLSEKQKQKLKLAGQGDIKRFNQKVAVVRERFEKVRFDQQKFNDIWQDIQPIQTQVQAGLFNRDSIFNKSVRPTLNPDQLAKYDRLDESRQKFLYRARVELCIATIENTLPLMDEQRESLIELIMKETNPPRAFGQYDTYVVMYNMSKIDQSKMKALFDDTQWKVFNQHIGQGRGMEQFLRQNGMLDDGATNKVRTE